MNFGEFVDNCSNEEFIALENAVNARRRKHNEEFAAKHSLTQDEKMCLNHLGRTVDTIKMVRDRLDCNLTSARMIVDNYRKYGD